MSARVLILNEDLADGNEPATTLKSLGLEVATVSYIVDAIAWLEEHSVDLIISPVHLISGDVFELLRWVRKNPGTKETPFIFSILRPSKLTKYLYPSIEVSARLLGATDVFMLDYYDESAFANKVEYYLSSAVADSAKMHPGRGNGSFSKNTQDPD